MWHSTSLLCRVKTLFSLRMGKLNTKPIQVWLCHHIYQGKQFSKDSLPGRKELNSTGCQGNLICWLDCDSWIIKQVAYSCLMLGGWAPATTVYYSLYPICSVSLLGLPTKKGGHQALTTSLSSASHQASCPSCFGAHERSTSFGKYL